MECLEERYLPWTPLYGVEGTWGKENSAKRPHRRRDLIRNRSSTFGHRLAPWTRIGRKTFKSSKFAGGRGKRRKRRVGRRNREEKKKKGRGGKERIVYREFSLWPTTRLTMSTGRKKEKEKNASRSRQKGKTARSGDAPKRGKEGDQKR